MQKMREWVSNEASKKRHHLISLAQYQLSGRITRWEKLRVVIEDQFLYCLL